MTDKTPRPVVLCILDGWGWREDRADNAVMLAKTPNFDAQWEKCPRAFLDACEEHVGLPKGQIGNSEVGHMNLGAGRVVFQDLPMIDRAIEKGELAKNAALGDLIAKLKKTGGACHLMGLCSPGGVHAHENHMLELARIVAGAGIKVAFHAFLDGRDVAPRSAAETIARVVTEIKKIGGASFVTLCGRYYAMDRDKRWDRVERAYNLLIDGQGLVATDPVAAIRTSYDANVTDEFVLPVALDGYQGMRDGDGLIMANFRADRARQILAALLDPEFAGFTRVRVVKFASALGMVEYSVALNKFLATIFPPKSIQDGMGEVVARAGLKQLRIAETEKYPHVTFFFNGGEERTYPGEDRIMVPSPKVATYDLKPEMSAVEMTDKVVAAIDSGKFDFILINYANPDMVGHTGDLQAAIKAVETVDQCLGRLLEAVKRQGGAALVTADHGNCEMMRDPVTGGPHTAHTLNRVPVFLMDGPGNICLQDGKLADVAPTLLALMHIPQPPAMDGHSLMLDEKRVVA